MCCYLGLGFFIMSQTGLDKAPWWLRSLKYVILSDTTERVDVPIGAIKGNLKNRGFNSSAESAWNSWCLYGY